VVTRKLDSSIESFPAEFCKYKILPELITALEFGGAGVKALNPILKIGIKLNSTEFEKYIIPMYV
jgi:SCY1-like protein 1